MDDINNTPATIDELTDEGQVSSTADSVGQNIVTNIATGKKRMIESDSSIPPTGNNNNHI